MKVFILSENNAGTLTEAEHGLSYLIEHEGIRILFDTGQSDLFLKNSAIMGVSLADIDFIILSHGHFDHGNGLEHLPGGTLVCHPACFIRRYRGSDHSYIGLKLSKTELKSRFNLIASREPYRISESVFFAGEIPRITSFESQTSTFVLEDGSPDFVADDSALYFTLPGGLFIITGCGHAGIVNTIEHAISVTGAESFYGIMGGFHLKENDLQTDETIRYLKNAKPVHILPSHCTSGVALTRFRTTFDTRPVRTGDILSF
ncbi:MAG: MBL fold metallo-hydrolase [Bacteroidales bacterium]|nr:MBL fold metallo-hydrolase [Bacteroidales bacterium]